MNKIIEVILNTNKIIENNIIPSIIISFILLITIVILIFKKLRSKNYKIKKINKKINEDFESGFELLISSDLEVIKSIITQNSSTKNTLKIKKELAKKHNLRKIFLKSLNKEIKENNQFNAIKIFKEINTSQVSDYLITYLYNPDKEIVKYSISILKEKKSPKVIESLKEYAKKINDLQMLELLKKVFIDFGPESAKKLLPLLKNSDPSMKKWIIDILGSFEEKDFSDILINELYIDNPEVKIAILRNLRNYDNKKIIQVFISHLNDENWAVRSKAAEELGQTKKEKTAPYLYEKLYDKSGIVRNTAANALFELGEHGIKYLIKAAREEEPPQEAIKILKKQDIASLIKNMEKLYIKK